MHRRLVLLAISSVVLSWAGWVFAEPPIVPNRQGGPWTRATVTPTRTGVALDGSVVTGACTGHLCADVPPTNGLGLMAAWRMVSAFELGVSADLSGSDSTPHDSLAILRAAVAARVFFLRGGAWDPWAGVAFGPSLLRRDFERDHAQLTGSFLGLLGGVEYRVERFAFGGSLELASNRWEKACYLEGCEDADGMSGLPDLVVLRLSGRFYL